MRLLTVLLLAANLFAVDTLSSANFRSLDYQFSNGAASDTLSSANFRQTFSHVNFVASDAITSANFITSLGLGHFFSDSVPAQQGDVIPPANTLVLTTGTLTDTSAVLQWDPAVLTDADADSVLLLFSETGYPDTYNQSGAQKGGAALKTARSMTVGALARGTFYYFSIFVRDTAGNWSDAPAAARASGATTGGPAYALSASSSTDSSIMLIASAFNVKSSGKNQMRILGSDSAHPTLLSDSTFAFTLGPVAIPASKDSVHDTLISEGLQASTVYYFALFVKDSVAGWIPTAFDSVTRTTLSPPGTPDTVRPGNNLTLNAAAQSDTSILLAWNPDTLRNLPDPDLDSIFIFMRQGSYPTYTKGGSLSNRIASYSADSTHPISFLKGGLKKDSLYYFALYVVDDSGNVSAGSARDTARAKEPPLVNDVQLNTTYLNSSSASLSWATGPLTANPQDTLLILMSTTGVPTGLTGATVVGKFLVGQDSAFIFTGLNPSTKYYFSVIVKSHSGLLSTVPAAARDSVSTPSVAGDRDTLVVGQNFSFNITGADTVGIPKSLGGGTALALRIPPGSIASGRVLAIVQFNEDTLKAGTTGYAPLGPVYDLSLSGGDTLKGPVTLVLTLNPNDLLGAVIKNLVFFNFDEALGEWRMVAGGSYDSAAHTFTVSLAHFSLYQLMIDSIIPYATPAAIPTPVAAGASRGIVFNVFDNTSQPPTVTFQARGGGDAFAVSTATLDSTKASGNLTRFRWSASLAASVVTNKGVSFRIITGDLTGRADTSTLDVPVLSPALAPAVSYALPGFESDDSLAWRMVSFPARLARNTLNSAFSFAGADTGTFRVFRYQTSLNTYNHLKVRNSSDTPDPGKAYWILTEKAVSSVKADTNTSTALTPFALVALDSGWNQVGNPYNFPVAWSEVLLANDATTRSALPTKPREWKKTGATSSFSQVDTLVPWRGYFLFADGAVSLKIPSGPAGTGKALAGFTPSASRFYIDLSAVGTRQAETAFRLGVTPAAKDGWDRLDIPKLPSLVKEVELYSRQGSGRFEEIWKPAEPQGQRFTFEVSTAGEQKVTLSSLPSTALPEGYVVYAADRARRVKFEVTGQPYTFFPEKGSANAFFLAAGSPAYVALALDGFLDLPTQFALSPNHPNPFNPATEIRFAVPSATAGAVRPPAVQLRIFDLRGRLVRTLINKPLSAGYYTVRWDGKGESAYGGKAAASGLYFYRLSGGKFIKTRKMIFSK